MTQPEIDREVSRVTGETMRAIKQRGFSVLPLRDAYFDDESHVLPRVVDWDAVDAFRRRAA
jgi:hypothetical protein